MMIAKPTRYQAAQLLLLLVLAFPFAVCAQDNAPTPGATPVPAEQVVSDQPAAETKPLTNFIETGGSYQTLTNGYGYWG